MRTLSALTNTEKAKTESEDILSFVDIYLDGETLHFVNSDENIAFFDPDGDAATYYALKMTRSPIEESADMRIQTITAGLDNVDQAMSSYIASKSFRDRRIVVRGCFRNLIASALNAWLIFDGYMDKPEIGETEFRIELVPRLGRGSLNTQVGVKQQMPCRHTFATGRCAYGVDADTLRDIKTAQEIDSGTTAYIIDSNRTEADDYWNYGYVVFAADTPTVALRGVNRMIKDFVAADDKVIFTIALPVAPQADEVYSIERGCDLTLDSCDNKFSNTDNFAALTTLPAMMVRK